MMKILKDILKLMFVKLSLRTFMDSCKNTFKFGR
jgi:hypothetical protein